ncbi:hypothetical protein KEM55_009233 [Ascosphaera atra]|nr:hypothetical protein KEM55_009233 [Ascosphaera atra]
MVELLKLSKRDWEDPYEKSRKLRRTFRVERKRLEAVDADNEAIKDRMGLGIELLEESEGDRVRAGMVQFQPGRGLGEIDPTKKPLFIEDKNDASGTSAGSGNKKRKLGAKELAAQRKTDLQKELKGNTRALLDPFLVDNSWEPAGRERKRNGRSSRVTASSSSISAPGSGYAPTSHSQSTSGDNGHDVGADTENAQPNALGTPDEDEIDNDTAGPGPPSHGDEKKQSQSRPALVDYGSDSD